MTLDWLRSLHYVIKIPVESDHERSVQSIYIREMAWVLIYVGGNIGDFPVLAIDLCPKGGVLAHFQSQGDSKKQLIY